MKWEGREGRKSESQTQTEVGLFCFCSSILSVRFMVSTVWLTSSHSYDTSQQTPPVSVKEGIAAAEGSWFSLYSTTL